MRNRMIRLKRESITIFILLLVGLVLFSSIFVVRGILGNPIIFGAESYSNLNHPAGSFDILLSFIPSSFHPYILLFQLACMLLSIYLFFLFISHCSIKQRNLSLLLFTLSPLALYLSSTITPYALALALSLCFLLAQQKNKTGFMYVLAVIIPFVELFSAVLLFLYSLLLYYQERKTSKAKSGVYVLAILIILLLLISGVSVSIITEHSLSSSRIISEFGAIQGYSIIFLFLGLIGLGMSWDRRNLLYPSLLLLLLLSFFSLPLRIFTVIVFSFFGAKSIEKLVLRRWQINYVKSFTLLLLFCTLLYSTLTQIKLESTHSPDFNDVQAYNFLRAQALGAEAVFTHPSNKEYLYYYTELLVPRGVSTQHEELLSTYKLEEAARFLDQEGIKYIYLDPATKRLWNIEETGLYFLLTNSESFIRIYHLDETEIYMYLSQEKTFT